MATFSDNSPVNSPINSPASQARSATRKPTAARLRKEQHILQMAELHFAQYGFEGASLDLMAQDAGISRHNLLYYFASKEELYLRVLGDVLTQWLAACPICCAAMTRPRPCAPISAPSCSPRASGPMAPRSSPAR
jgi:TetR/AcrR family transcriptional regulator